MDGDIDRSAYSDREQAGRIVARKHGAGNRPAMGDRADVKAGDNLIELVEVAYFNIKRRNAERPDIR